MTVQQENVCVVHTRTSTSLTTTSSIKSAHLRLHDTTRHPSSKELVAVSFDCHEVEVDRDSRTTSIFRPISEERAACCPPLYRDTSLLSSPSRGVSSSSSFFSFDNNEEGLSTVPDDFVPPRHTFAPRQLSISRGALIDKTNNETAGQPSLSTTHQIIKLQPQDIVFGRGAPVDFHPGNQAYRELIQQYEASYVCSKRSDKPHIAFELLETLKARGVRFVKREKQGSGFIWVEMSRSRAYEKVCHSLREGAPEVRRRMMSLATTAIREAEKTKTGNRTTLFRDESLFFGGEAGQDYTPIPFF